MNDCLDALKTVIMAMANEATRMCNEGKECVAYKFSQEHVNFRRLNVIVIKFKVIVSLIYRKKHRETER